MLRRAKNIKNAPETERDGLLEDAERLENLCVWLVFAGIALEAVIAAAPLFVALSTVLAGIGNALADGAVALGVLGELRFGNVVGAVLKVKLAEAVERAAKAEQETERLRLHVAWRTIGVERLKKLTDELAKSPGHVTIEFPAGDPETQNFVSFISLAFELGKWQVTQCAATFRGGVMLGLIVPEPKGPAATAITSIQTAFSAAGVDFKVWALPRYRSANMTGAPQTQGAPHIYVGPKGPLPSEE